jgi:glycyl-tRNA synthetase beta subunit
LVNSEELIDDTEHLTVWYPDVIITEFDSKFLKIYNLLPYIFNVIQRVTVLLISR